jgi:hypothetical protein
VNTDMDLRLQYLAGMGLNFNDATYIKREISRYYEVPKDMFQGDPERVRRVWESLQ